ncbi:MAG TPA: recombinase family protein [Isosphaeraceae bacterium]|nr:recombinase family protein [Isosphaeraceae bacterium]
MRELLRKGDVLVVWRLDRLGRSLKHLVELMTELEQAGIGFQSLQVHILKMISRIAGQSFSEYATTSCCSTFSMPKTI